MYFKVIKVNLLSAKGPSSQRAKFVCKRMKYREVRSRTFADKFRVQSLGFFGAWQVKWSVILMMYEYYAWITIVNNYPELSVFQLSFGDGLPENVCAECMELVGKCFTFKQLCERSESMLRCLVSQGNLQGMKEEPHPFTNPESVQIFYHFIIWL